MSALRPVSSYQGEAHFQRKTDALIKQQDKLSTYRQSRFVQSVSTFISLVAGAKASGGILSMTGFAEYLSSMRADFGLTDSSLSSFMHPRVSARVGGYIRLVNDRQVYKLTEASRARGRAQLAAEAMAIFSPRAVVSDGVSSAQSTPLAAGA